MMINWKIRFKNTHFLGQVLIAFAVPIFSYFGLSATDVTTWNVLFTTIGKAMANPYVVLTIIVSVYNAINDPTTIGLSDSEKALKKTTLKGE